MPVLKKVLKISLISFCLFMGGDGISSSYAQDSESPILTLSLRNKDLKTKIIKDVLTSLNQNGYSIDIGSLMKKSGEHAIEIPMGYLLLKENGRLGGVFSKNEDLARLYMTNLSILLNLENMANNSHLSVEKGSEEGEYIVKTNLSLDYSFNLAQGKTANDLYRISKEYYQLKGLKPEITIHFNTKRGDGSRDLINLKEGDHPFDLAGNLDKFLEVDASKTEIKFQNDDRKKWEDLLKQISQLESLNSMAKVINYADWFPKKVELAIGATINEVGHKFFQAKLLPLVDNELNEIYRKVIKVTKKKSPYLHAPISENEVDIVFQDIIDAEKISKKIDESSKKLERLRGAFKSNQKYFSTDHLRQESQSELGSYEKNVKDLYPVDYVRFKKQKYDNFFKRKDPSLEIEIEEKAKLLYLYRHNPKKFNQDLAKLELNYQSYKYNLGIKRSLLELFDSNLNLPEKTEDKEKFYQRGKENLAKLEEKYSKLTLKNNASEREISTLNREIKRERLRMEMIPSLIEKRIYKGDSQQAKELLLKMYLKDPQIISLKKSVEQNFNTKIYHLILDMTSSFTDKEKESFFQYMFEQLKDLSVINEKKILRKKFDLNSLIKFVSEKDRFDFVKVKDTFFDRVINYLESARSKKMVELVEKISLEKKKLSFLKFLENNEINEKFFIKYNSDLNDSEKNLKFIRAIEQTVINEIALERRFNITDRKELSKIFLERMISVVENKQDEILRADTTSNQNQDETNLEDIKELISEIEMIVPYFKNRSTTWSFSQIERIKENAKAIEEFIFLNMPGYLDVKEEYNKMVVISKKIKQEIKKDNFLLIEVRRKIVEQKTSLQLEEKIYTSDPSYIAVKDYEKKIINEKSEKEKKLIENDLNLNKLRKNRLRVLLRKDNSHSEMGEIYKKYLDLEENLIRSKQEVHARFKERTGRLEAERVNRDIIQRNFLMNQNGGVSKSELAKRALIAVEQINRELDNIDKINYLDRNEIIKQFRNKISSFEQVIGDDRPEIENEIKNINQRIDQTTKEIGGESVELILGNISSFEKEIENLKIEKKRIEEKNEHDPEIRLAEKTIEKLKEEMAILKNKNEDKIITENEKEKVRDNIDQMGKKTKELDSKIEKREEDFKNIPRILKTREAIRELIAQDENTIDFAKVGRLKKIIELEWKKIVESPEYRQLLEDKKKIQEKLSFEKSFLDQVLEIEKQMANREKNIKFLEQNIIEVRNENRNGVKLGQVTKSISDNEEMISALRSKISEIEGHNQNLKYSINERMKLAIKLERIKNEMASEQSIQNQIRRLNSRLSELENHNLSETSDSINKKIEIIVDVLRTDTINANVYFKNCKERNNRPIVKVNPPDGKKDENEFKDKNDIIIGVNLSEVQDLIRTHVIGQNLCVNFNSERTCDTQGPLDTILNLKFSDQTEKLSQFNWGKSRTGDKDTLYLDIPNIQAEISKGFNIPLINKKVRNSIRVKSSIRIEFNMIQTIGEDGLTRLSLAPEVYIEDFRGMNRLSKLMAMPLQASGIKSYLKNIMNDAINKSHIDLMPKILKTRKISVWDNLLKISKERIYPGATDWKIPSLLNIPSHFGEHTVIDYSGYSLDQDRQVLNLNYKIVK